jgi:hypothetical protein
LCGYHNSLRNVLALLAAVAAAAVVEQGVSAGDMVVVEGDRHGQGPFQAEGHQEDLAYAFAAAVEGDVRDRTLEGNRLDLDLAACDLGEVLVQVRIPLEAGSLVAGDHPGRDRALLGHAEGEDRGVDAAVMGQGEADLGEAQKLHQGRGVQQVADVHQGLVHRSAWERARRLAWNLVREVEGGSSRRP